jgi:hypothetical protein
VPSRLKEAADYVRSPLFDEHCKAAGHSAGLKQALLETLELGPAQRKTVCKNIEAILNEDADPIS